MLKQLLHERIQPQPFDLEKVWLLGVDHHLLEAVFRSEREFVRDASHEVRVPLTIRSSMALNVRAISAASSAPSTGMR